MSRRSLISAEENLIRSQRRGVPNVRMWSEQETPPRVAWDGYEEEPGMAPPLPDRIFHGHWEVDEAYGNGVVYPVPPAVRAVSLGTDGLGDITGLPCLALIVSFVWTNITPPAGWTKVAEHSLYESRTPIPGLLTAQAWAIDSYAGQGFNGTCNPPSGLGLGGANMRLNTTLLVGDVPGRWEAVLGTPDADALVLSDPGGSHRLQWVSTSVRYDRAWAPQLPPGMARRGNLFVANMMNPSAPDGWSDAALLSSASMGSGRYVPSVGGCCIPVNVRWSE